MPLIGYAIDATVLAHGGNKNSIFERDVAQREGQEKRRHCGRTFAEKIEIEV